ncbi:MAG: DUF4364 family protein [Clostridium sp.]|nr:DUF4364 family protein [Clostridium sp.]
MMSEPVTLYKLMVLYMLSKVTFPLTGAQFSDFFLTREYTNYFSLQNALTELTEAGLIRKEELHSSSRYEITHEGVQALDFFGSKISPEIIEDIDSFLSENRLRMKEAVGTVSEFYRADTRDYMVHCEIREGKSHLINLDIAVPDEEQAGKMSNHWKKRSQEIYAFIMKTLMKEDDEL